jgi:hypothetical protein
MRAMKNVKENQGLCLNLQASVILRSSWEGGRASGLLPVCEELCCNSIHIYEMIINPATHNNSGDVGTLLWTVIF